MSKYDNYIFLTICEVSYKHYKFTNYSSYPEYCKGMSMVLNGVYTPAKSDKRMINDVIQLLDTVYSLSAEVTGKYIGDYFALDSLKHSDFMNFLN